MRIVQWVLMILGWWSGGLLLSSKVIQCRAIALRPADSTEAIVNPCPKLNYKCWLASCISLAYGVAWHFAMGWKPPVPGLDYFVSVAMGAVLGAAVARILCPK